MTRLVFIVIGCVFLLAGSIDKAYSSQEEIEAGRQLYLKYGCAVCHGKEGYGNGPAAQRLYYPPTNFHNTKSYRVGPMGIQMKDVIIKGVKEENSIMPAFVNIPDREVDQIVTFLLSLQDQKRENSN